MSRLSEAEYIAIKQLLDRGIQGNKVAEVFNRGKATISYIKNSQDFNDYRERPTNMLKASKDKKQAEQLTLDVPEPVEDKQADIFVAVNDLIEAIWTYQTHLDDLGLLNSTEAKAIDIATQKIEEARFWLKAYL